MAVLVPAHNEEKVIGKTLDQINQQLQPHDRLLVVADNCSDQTAAIALSKKAEVVERCNDQKRGKGFALDFGIQHLKKNPPDVVVVMDADVEIAPETIKRISRSAYNTKRPTQARYLLKLSDKKNSKNAISAFAFLFKNCVRPLGLTRLGDTCLLTGTGMAFTWEVISNAQLASGNIVEDMQLGIDLAIGGLTAKYIHEALITSEMAPTDKAAKTQRTRWEHGHFMTIASQTGRLFREAIKQQRLDLALLGLEISVPPLAFFTVVLVSFFMVTLLSTIFNIIPYYIALSYGALIIFLKFIILTSWFYWGREIITGKQLFSIPLYALWKVPIYINLFNNKKIEWKKTERK